MRDKVADNSPLLELPLMNHIDLFSGIGGFALAARTVWGKDYHNLFFCDNNKFCAEVLKKNFGKDSLIYEDIKEVTRERFIADTCPRNPRSGDEPASGRGQCPYQGTETQSAGTLGGQGNGRILQGQRNQKFGRDEVIANTRIQKSNGLSSIKWKENTSIGRGSSRITSYSTSGESGELSEQKGRKDIIRRGVKIDLLTGGFPCQPFSQAGRRRGVSDDRFLWPEMFRVIKEFQPTYVIGENVAGILSMAQFKSKSEMGSETDLFGNKHQTEHKIGRGILYGIIEQLGEIGYAVEVFVIPACAVNAPHRRDRVWIVANRVSNGTGGAHGEDVRECGEERQEPDKCKGRKVWGDVRDGNSNASNSNTAGQPNRNKQYRGDETPQGKRERSIVRQGDDDTNTEGKRLERGEIESELEKGKRNRNITDPKCEGHKGDINKTGQDAKHSGNEEWSRNWIKVATEFCGVDDEFPDWVDKYMETESGYKITKAGHRVERLKALGNAIVPQVAVEIMRGIKMVETGND